VVSFSGKNLTRQAVTENLNVLDYETYFTSTDLILDNKIPELLIQFNNTLSKGFDGHHYIAGLASHFRDLLVSQTPETIALLEVGEQTKEKYTITHDGEKKNSKHYIIPASYFQKKGITPIPVNRPSKTENVSRSAEAKKETTEPKKEVSEVVKQFQVKETPKIVLRQDTKRASGLSLKSIKAKKEHLVKQMDVVVDEENLPSEPFTEDALLTAWNTFIEKLRQEGLYCRG